MGTSYPAALDDFPNPTGTTAVDTATANLAHDLQHSNANDAVEAIQAELGTAPSGSFATVKARLDARRRTVVTPAASGMVCVPGVTFNAVGSGSSFTAGSDWYFPLWCEDYTTFDRVYAEVSTAAAAGKVARAAIYGADASWQPTGTLIEDFGTFATDSTGVKTMTPAGGSRTLPGGRYLLALAQDGAAGFRFSRGSFQGHPLSAALGTAPGLTLLSNSRSYAAFPSSPTPWNTAAYGTAGFNYPLFLRVTAVG